MRCWCGYLSEVRCRLFAYGPGDATGIPKLHNILPHLNSNWFLPFLYRLIQVVLEKKLLNGCSSNSSTDKVKEVMHRKPMHTNSSGEGHKATRQLHILQTTRICKPYMSSLDMSECKSRGSNMLSAEHFY